MGEKPECHADADGCMGNPICLLGMFLYWVWIILFIGQTVVLDERVFPVGIPFHVFEYLARFFGCLITLLVFRLNICFRKHTVRWVAAAIFGFVGTFGLMLIPSDSAAGASGHLNIFLSCILCGIVDEVVVVSWLTFFRDRPLRSTIICLSISFGLAAPAACILLLLPAQIIAWMESIIAVLAVIAVAFVFRTPKREFVDYGHTDTSLFRNIDIWRFYSMAFIISCAAGLFGAALGRQIIPPSTLHLVSMAGIVGGATIVLLLSTSDSYEKLSLIFRSTFYIQIAGLACIVAAVSAPQFMWFGSFLFLASYSTFFLLVMVLTIRLSMVYELSTYLNMPISTASCALGLFVGTLAGAVLVFQNVGVANPSFWCGVVMIICVAARMCIFGPERLHNFSHEPVDPKGTEDVVSGFGPWRRRCGIVCNRFGLTTRESEVFVLLAKGRDAQYVADKFILSPHTVKTHIKNIHTKLNVHSQQEIIDLVESVELEPERVLFGDYKNIQR